MAAQSRFAIEEALREGGTIWEWLLLLGTGFVLGLTLLFPAFMIKYRRQSAEPSYASRCCRAAIAASRGFTLDVLLALIIGTPLLLVPSGIVVATVNVLLFRGSAGWLIDAWIIALVVCLALGSCVYGFIMQLRESSDLLL